MSQFVKEKTRPNKQRAVIWQVRFFLLRRPMNCFMDLLLELYIDFFLLCVKINVKCAMPTIFSSLRLHGYSATPIFYSNLFQEFPRYFEMISKEKNHGTTFHENVIDYTEIKKNRVKKIGLYNRHYFYTLKQVIPPTYSSLLICNRADNNDSHRGYYLGGVFFSKRPLCLLIGPCFSQNFQGVFWLLIGPCAQISSEE